MILIQNKEQQIVLSWKDIEGLKTKLRGLMCDMERAQIFGDNNTRMLLLSPKSCTKFHITQLTTGIRFLTLFYPLN